MNIVVGSRREGNSLKLAALIKQELDKNRIASNIIVPGNQKIHICTGCMDCDEKGICDFKDDMKRNIEQIKEDDYLMIITPTRWNNLSGDLKVFMDRLNPMYKKRELNDKKVILVSIGAKKKENGSVDDALQTLKYFAKSAHMTVLLEKSFYNCLKENDILNSPDLKSFCNSVLNLFK